MSRLNRRMRRKVALYLITRVDITFPEDWSDDFTIRDVVKLWLLMEGERR